MSTVTVLLDIVLVIISSMIVVIIVAFSSWLSDGCIFIFLLATLAYCCQHNMAAHYLAIQLNQASSDASRQRLRSASTPELIVPRTSRSTIGDRAWPQLGSGIPWHRPCSLLSLLQFFNVTWRLNCSRAPSQTNYFSERSVLRDSVYFTTFKSLDYNVVKVQNFFLIQRVHVSLRL